MFCSKVFRFPFKSPLRFAQGLKCFISTGSNVLFKDFLIFAQKPSPLRPKP